MGRPFQTICVHVLRIGHINAGVLCASFVEDPSRWHVCSVQLKADPVRSQKPGNSVLLVMIKHPASPYIQKTQELWYVVYIG